MFCMIMSTKMVEGVTFMAVTPTTSKAYSIIGDN